MSGVEIVAAVVISSCAFSFSYESNAGAPSEPGGL